MEEYLSLFDQQPEKTCFVLEDGKVVFSSSASGVKPLLDFLALNQRTKLNLTVVDKIVGKGAMLLAIYINAKSIYTKTISQEALDLGKRYKLTIGYETLVPYIENRDKTGRCPIEQSLLEIDDLELGFQTILKTLDKLKNQA